MMSASEDASQLELSLSQDKELKTHMDFINFILHKHVLKHDTEGNQTLQLFQAASASLSKFLAKHLAE